MINPQIIRKISEVEPHLRDILISILEEIEKHRQQVEQQVTKTEFNELKEVVYELAKRVNELAEAQKRTEQRVNELAQAQKKSEQRLTRLEEAVERLAEAQKKTEQRLTRLEEAVERLAEAQRKSEERITRLEEAVERLTEAQKKTEQRLNELAEAQKKTEEVVKRLALSIERTNQQVGGLSRSIAYALENEAYRNLPQILKSLYGIEIIDRFIRTYIGDEEINIFAKAKKDGQDVCIVGEAVLKLDDKTKVKSVLDKANIVKQEVGGDVIPILVTHFARPNILERAKKAGIIVIQSFEW